MVVEHFDRYSDSVRKGLRSDATVALRAFIESFRTVEEKRTWSETYLTNVWDGRKIRYELYEQVIFPALLEGYRRSDPWSLRWTAKTIQNLYGARHLWEQVGLKADIEFLEELLALRPDDEDARLCLLSSYVDGLRYAVHEWPSGILYGKDGATLEECSQIRKELERARSLDRSNRFLDFLADFEKKLDEYAARIAGA